MRYELVNPSDRYYLTAPTKEIACVAAIILGEGRYGLKDEITGETVLPVLLLASAKQIDEWSVAAFGAPLDTVLKRGNLPAVADAMQSVADSLPEDRRSSMNNIGKYAAAYAASIRAAAAATAAP